MVLNVGRYRYAVAAAIAGVVAFAIAVYAQGGAGGQGRAGGRGRGAGSATTQPAALRPAGADWPAYGYDSGARRFSPLTHITPQNVGTLTRAWTFDTEVSGSQYTPLVINGVMYVSNTTHLIALEPETGRIIYKVPHEGLTRRGFGYWPGEGTIGARFFSGASGGRMVAIDVRSGQPALGFGVNGYVDLRALAVIDGGTGSFSMPSPPAVYRNVVITSGSNGEGAPGQGRPYGDVQGWDARTGAHLWTFHTVPRPGEPGHETWPPNGWRNRGGANAWGFMTVDEQRGLVYVPTGVATDDWYGADRHGDNLYANSVVALDALTGKLRWHQQLVHHDIWDWDAAAPPTLVDVRRGNEVIPAIAQTTKMGILFILNRETGEYVFGVDERPVPQSDVPGERTAKTQPFPRKPMPLARLTFDPAKDFNTVSPETEKFCRNFWAEHQMFFHGPYGPMMLDRLTVTFPSTLGGGGWGGVSFNPQLDLIFVNVSHLGMVGKMEKTDEGYYRKTSPVGGAVGRFWDPDSRIPCSAPPFGELVAVHASTGDIAWRVPLGFNETLAARGIRNTGTLTLGGSMATASGLVFIAATADRRFRAFDAATGKELWVAEIGSDTKAAPMTYLGRDGRQYVALMVGGGHQLSRTVPEPGADSELIAFALPQASGAK
jgi:quinoprotein glucose dehydrogenase